MGRKHRTRGAIAADFCGNTSAHGFANAHRCASWCGRGVWIVFMVAMWGLCVYQLYASIDKFFKYETTVAVQMQHAHEVAFPAVTICNLNPMRYGALTAALDTLGVNVSALFQTDSIEHDHPAWENALSGHGGDTELTPENAVRQNIYRVFYDSQLDHATLGHNLETMMLDCTYQSLQCFPYNFTRWSHASYGNCYTFFAKNDASGFIGPSYGLSVTLFVEDKHYLPRISSSAGFRVQVHPPEYVPLPEDHGITVSPGALTSIAVRQLLISRQALPYDQTDCGTQTNEELQPTNLFRFWVDFVQTGDIEKANYTAHSCVQSCFLKQIEKKCSCMDASLLPYEHARSFYNGSPPAACDKSDSVQLECVRQTSKALVKDSLCDAACPQACVEHAYVPRVTSSLWPRDAYFATMAASWGKRLGHMDLSNAAAARQELVKIDIYFEEFNYESVVESPAMDVWSLLSNVGGTLGLYVGLSFLTVLEFAELLLHLSRARNDDAVGAAANADSPRAAN